MALVNYSDSESEDGDDKKDVKNGVEKPTPNLKRKRVDEAPSASAPASALPPLPVAFHDLYATNVRVGVKDDPALHDGRKRSTPHVGGNWPTHVYLEWYPNQTELKALSAVIAKMDDALLSSYQGLNSFLYSDLGVQLPLHISLSRPVVLLTNQRQPFHDLLEAGVSSSGIRPFDITVTGLDWVPNFEGNRWFLVMKLSKPSNDGLNKLLQLSNKGLAAFEQRPLYDEGEKDGSIFRRDLSQADTRGKGRGRGRRTSRDQTLAGGESTTEYVPDYSSYFHISIAWRLDEPTTEGKSQVVGLDLKELESLSIKFSNVKVKIGNAVHSIALPVETIDQKGFGGL